MNAKDIKPAVIMAMAEPLKGAGTSALAKLFTHGRKHNLTREKNQQQRQIHKRWIQKSYVVHISLVRATPKYRTIGSYQVAKIFPVNGIKVSTGFMNHHFGKLYDHGNN